MKTEYCKITIDIKSVSKARVLDFLKLLSKEIEKTHSNFDTHDYKYETGGVIISANLNIENKELQNQEIQVCKSCKKTIDENAISSTGLCTACFTSNA